MIVSRIYELTTEDGARRQYRADESVCVVAAYASETHGGRLEYEEARVVCIGDFLALIDEGPLRLGITEIRKITGIRYFDEE